MRVRPGRPSRPRTRIRPGHAGAVDGVVVAVDRGRYTCRVDDLNGRDAQAGGEVIARDAQAGGEVIARDAQAGGEVIARDAPTVTAMRARELGRRSVVVGDRVALVGDTSGAPGALARIVRIAPRRSVLRRSADDETTPEGRQERVVVANADQLVIVSSLADPPPRTGFIDRCLVAAYDAEIEPLLCLTKADLARPDGVLQYYAELDLPHVLCRPDAPLDDLRQALAGRLSVLVGHSGVGKSTLVNRLVPEAERAVGEVSAVGKGRHTSSSAVMLHLSGRPGAGTDPGWIVDTPGVRSFGLAHVSADSLLHGFPDLVEGTTQCPPNCEHAAAEAAGGRVSGARMGNCALDAWVAAGHADPRRLASFRRLLASRSGEEPT